jgi:Domain of unknown function (DUF6371)
MDHQFQFDKNRKRAELCPCGKSNRDGKFSPFKGFTDKGRCFGCVRNFYPEKEEKNNTFNFVHNNKPKPTIERPISLINVNIFRKSLTLYDANKFVTYLKTVFRPEFVDLAIEKYKIGTSKLWNGATVFWQIDELGNARTGKIMLYDDHTGKRVKKPFDHINWVHSVLKIDDYNLGQVFFGTQCISSSSGTVAIVESEKTAIIASICLPKVTWLAAGSKDGLKIEKFKPLKNRNIILYPDANAFELWSTFALKHKDSFKIKVSSLIDHSLTDDKKEQGEDIADFLLKSIPDHLRVNYIPESLAEIISIPDGSDTFQNNIAKNPNLNTLVSRLNLVIDPNPSDNCNWQNDIPATIKAINLEIKPDTAYHIDELKSLIKTHHTALNIDYGIIIRQLITNQVIIQNVLNDEYYYKYGSTPF